MEENKNAANDQKLGKALEGLWDSLSDEQKEKARQCKTTDELMKLAAKERIELPDEVLEHVAGGFIHYNKYAPYGERYEAIWDSDGSVFGKFEKEEDAIKRAALFNQYTSYIDDDALKMIRTCA